MSLVGSLEDLGLGDILQIVSLSRKSGLLLIHSDQGEARLIFCDGLVRAAFVKGESDDLRALLVTSGFVEAEDFERAVQLAAAREVEVAEVVPECTSLSKERLDSLQREHVERAVFRIFSWRGGEFSFEVRDEVEERDREILLPVGINPQYLSMEAARLGDERDQGAPGTPEPPGTTPEGDGGESDELPVFSGEEPEVPREPAPEPGDSSHEVVALSAVRRVETAATVAPEPPVPAQEEPGPTGARAVRPGAPPREAGPTAGRAACLIAIDPELGALEWQKSVLAELFGRVHIFQRVEGGVARIRQYLARGEVPLVLASVDLPPDPATGTSGIAEFIRRLKLQAPFMPVLVAGDEGSAESIHTAGADATLSRPPAAVLAARRNWRDLGAEAGALREQMRPWIERAGIRAAESAAAAPGGGGGAGVADAGLRRLRDVSERMRDPSMQGEILALVLEFAAESFPRVAMFMVRDDSAVGMAQIGLALCGGPQDEGFRRIELPARDVECFRRVLEERAARRAEPGPGDRGLVSRLGTQTPSEAYVAPIESGGQVAALLYADRLPDRSRIGDTTLLEIALHEAGLALDRALLERALAGAGS